MGMTDNRELHTMGMTDNEWLQILGIKDNGWLQTMGMTYNDEYRQWEWQWMITDNINDRQWLL